MSLIDMTIMATALASIAGFGLAKAGMAGVDQTIQGSGKVNIDVYLTGLRPETSTYSR